MPLWFDTDCMPKLLIDDDDLSDSEEPDDDYEMTLQLMKINPNCSL